MKKVWQIISKKDLVFGLLIFAAVIIVSFRPSNKVKVSFGEESVDLRTTKFSMNIPYEMVESIELAERAENGEEIDGHDDMIVLTGEWKNEEWGEYTACIELATNNCILVYLNDGRLFVISRRDDEETAVVYEQFCEALETWASGQ